MRMACEDANSWYLGRSCGGINCINSEAMGEGTNFPASLSSPSSQRNQRLSISGNEIPDVSLRPAFLFAALESGVEEVLLSSS